MSVQPDLLQAVELAIRLATKACEDVRVLAREGLRPGPPGLGFDDMSLDYDGKQTIIFRFAKGEQIKEYPIKLDIPYDAGIYRDGEIYPKSALTTFGGRAWIAQCETSTKPDMTNKDWRLWSNKGRDGKDGVMRQLSPPGPVKLS